MFYEVYLSTLDLTGFSIEVLKNEFNTIPVKYIKEVQKDKKHLYPAYLALNEAKHTDPCPYGKTPWRPLRDINFDLLQATKHQKANISVLKEQFESAQKAVIEINLQRRKSNTRKIKEEMEAAAKAREEQSALEHAKATGTVVEWQVIIALSCPHLLQLLTPLQCCLL